MLALEGGWLFKMKSRGPQWQVKTTCQVEMKCQFSNTSHQQSTGLHAESALGL